MGDILAFNERNALCFTVGGWSLKAQVQIREASYQTSFNSPGSLFLPDKSNDLISNGFLLEIDFFLSGLKRCFITNLKTASK